ncbi:MAG: hypothetical protein AAB967_01655, partial [Patescibacteria group bacterium]
MGNTVTIGGEHVSAFLKKRLVRTARELLRALKLEEIALEIFLLSGDNMLTLKEKFPPKAARSPSRGRATVAHMAAAGGPVD